MQTEQLNLFDMPNVPPSVVPVTKKIQGTIVPDVRTEGQMNNRVAFDVGETIGGSKKALAKQKEAFLSKPSLHLLKELERIDVSTAAQVIVRETFFTWFSLENCRERGVEPSAAKALELIINRLPKTSLDSAEHRQKYVNTMTFLSDLLRVVTTMKDYYSFEQRVLTILVLPSSDSILESELKMLESRLTDESNVEKLAKIELAIEFRKAELFLYDFAATMALDDYKGPFRNYWRNHQSRVAVLRNAESITDWDELIPPVSDKVKPQRVIRRKPVWERQLPELPTRTGGQQITITNPKTYIEHFGFRASEFGHYVDDKKGQEHLLRSAEAFTDLADILEVPIKSVSLHGELAMAFGARGSGRALGHYETGRKVINLTKEKGSLGILAHEWFHGLDHYLYNFNHSFNNGLVGFITENEHGVIHLNIDEKLNALLDAIKVGTSTSYIDVSNCTRKFRVGKIFTDLYKVVNGDLHQFMDRMMRSLDRREEAMMEGIVSERRLLAHQKSYVKKRVRELKKNAEALAEYHFIITGEQVTHIPYTSNRTHFYEHSIQMDKGKEGKYWSSNRELTARVFECFIYEEILKRGWTSDYLVCGIRDSVFPKGREREQILKAMNAFIESIRPFLCPF